MSASRDIIAIGASAGGVEALSAILAELRPDLPAAVFVVLHTSPHAPSVLPKILSRAGPLPALHPANGDRIINGRVYVAPPDYHMLLLDGTIRIARGAPENYTRPAIDPLFRSAALYYGSRTVGVVLTGFLDDGTAGLLAIKARGGLAVVQDPADAREPSMPKSAIEHVEIDHVLPLSMIGPTLNQLAGDLVKEHTPPPDEALEIETRIAAGEPLMVDADEVHKLGAPSVFSCPECHGVLFEVKAAKPMRFRCRVGHAYSAQSLMACQTTSLQGTLWAALRALEESAHLTRRMADRSRNDLAARRLRAVAEERWQHAQQLRRALLDLRTAAE